MQNIRDPINTGLVQLERGIVDLTYRRADDNRRLVEWDSASHTDRDAAVVKIVQSCHQTARGTLRALRTCIALRTLWSLRPRRSLRSW